MPRTEPTTERRSTEPPLPRQPTSAAASSLAQLTAPAPPRTRHPTTDRHGSLLLDWKDAVCLFGLLTGMGTTLVGIDEDGALGTVVAGALLVIAAVGASVGRRIVYGGPAPVVRGGLAWGAARVVGGACLFFGFFVGLFAALSPSAPVWAGLCAIFCLALGAGIDHLVRQPKDEDEDP